ncbi:hypothetical protein NJLHNGOC_12315 [Novacetimonas cocois]|uniref:Uncharacterized protein n=1 Tax=Novacetimonas cocois TaxID=1747507 RepID=A0A365YSW8_9PROT|nr:hypothetical protein NJLHNGOC_12315 [Novacetimonas cocois]
MGPLARKAVPKNPHKTSCKYKEVFGEAFFKKLRKNAAFLKKGSTQKTFTIQDRDVGRGRVFSKRGANGSSTRK